MFESREQRAWLAMEKRAKKLTSKREVRLQGALRLSEGTLSVEYHRDGAEILVEQRGHPPRRLRPRDLARVMGFDDSFGVPVADPQSSRQFGNSVVTPVFQEIARIMKPHLMQVKATTAAERAEIEAAGAQEHFSAAAAVEAAP